MTTQPKVIIIGAGFGGLFAARNLLHQSVDILMIDRNNFHTFTPLLYQVATCGLDPSEIAYPVRSIFRRKQNIRFMLGEVTEIDSTNKQVAIKSADIVRYESYDYLIIAAGSVTNFFTPQVEQSAFGLKSLSDAVVLRNHILKLFEKADWTDDPSEREALMTLVVVGGGPTGLETAGALYELYNFVLGQEYEGERRMQARVILVEAAENLLLAYPHKLQQAALRQLQSLGVEVILGQAVEETSDDHIRLKNGEIIRTHTLVWAAGVKGAPLASLLGVELQRGGRIPVEPTMRVIGRDDIYAIGDIAYLIDPKGQPYAQVIQVAQQQGKLVAQNIARHLTGQSEASFVYKDLGIMATIGRSRAVAWLYYKIQLTGFVGWVAWLVLHLIWLMGFRNRLNVLVNWTWNYLTYDRSVRIILERDADDRIKEVDHQHGVQMLGGD
ncbi:MAG: NAD(P)/FAD-dependent oxidoreductase [Chitinophagaceae bacterium]|nr:NAD(P)/FAD-dependent oxidoreductase [Anaerolineae bacterium]